MVIEGEEARTINLCKLCYNAKLVKQGKHPLKLWEWKEVVEKQAHLQRLLKEVLRGMWECFTVATGVTLKRFSGTSQMKCGYRLRSLDDVACLHRNEAWQLGEFQGRIQEGRKAL